MVKRSRILLVFISLLMLSACTDWKNKEVGIENIPIDQVQDAMLEDILPEIQTEGIYQVTTRRKSYFVFNGVKSTYSNVSVSVENEILKVEFDKRDSDQSNQQIYQLKPYPLENIHMIQLFENGVETHFETNYF